MIDSQIIKKDPDKIKKICKLKNIKCNVDDLIVKDTERRELIASLDDLKNQRNAIATEVSKLSGKPPEDLVSRGKSLKEEIAKLEAKYNTVQKDFEVLLSQVPNFVHSDTPVGASEADNKVLRHWGVIPEFNFKPKDHLELGSALDLIDFETGAKVAGSKFYYLKNEWALLEIALMQYGLVFLTKEGFIPYITPDLAKSEYYLGTGYAPRGDEAQTYEIVNEDLGLIATAEVTMAAYHAGDILEEASLPRKYVAYSHCFRRESGAYGKYAQGIYRVHQFSKVEMFMYAKSAESDLLHKQILDIEERIVQSLKLPYRVIEMCTGDLGAMAARKYDLEAWMPGRNDYGEITSCSNCTDYQARNLNIKYRTKDGSLEYLHMLNGTAVVSSRFALAIIENNQQEDGSILIPEVLWPYMGGITQIKN